jgi:hypothetical protein
MKAFQFEKLPPAEAQKIYPALWATVRQTLPEAGDEDLAAVVSLAVNTCHYCYERSRPCSCARDA